MAISGTTTQGDAGQPSERVATKRWRSEDWMAVVLGLLVIATVVGLFQWKVVDLRSIVSTYRWTTDAQIAALTPGWIDALDSIAKDAEAKRQPNVVALSKGLEDALASKDRKAIEAAAGKLAALGNRTMAGALGAEIRGHATAVADTRIFTWPNLSKVVYVGLALLIVATAGIALLGG